MHNAEARGGLAGKLLPMRACRFEHIEGADEVGLNEGRSVRNRSVDMAFGGEMEDDVRLMRGKRRFERSAVANVSLQKMEFWRLGHTRERCEMAGIGQLIEDDGRPANVLNRMAHERGADKARPSRDQRLHEALPVAAPLEKRLQIRKPRKRPVAF
jgi:hypothetical protein